MNTVGQRSDTYTHVGFMHTQIKGILEDDPPKIDIHKEP